MTFNLSTVKNICFFVDCPPLANKKNFFKNMENNNDSTLLYLNKLLSFRCKLFASFVALLCFSHSHRTKGKPQFWNVVSDFAGARFVMSGDALLRHVWNDNVSDQSIFFSIGKCRREIFFKNLFLLVSTTFRCISNVYFQFLLFYF
jgi:hypothetical protein